MAFQPAPACAQAVMRYGYTTAGIFTHANVLNFRKVGGVAFTEADLEALGEILNAWDNDFLDGLRQTGYKLIDIELRGLDSAEAPYWTETVNRAGMVAGDAAPPNVAACMTLSTGLTGRSARGRTYFAGLSEVQIDNTSLVSGVVTGFNAAGAGLLAELTSGALFDLVVLSRFTDGAKRVTANPLKVTGFSLRDGILDTQRRRINRFK